MKHATTNQDVISSCESKIRESTKTIGWFEESLRDLEGRLRDGSISGPSGGNGNNGGGGRGGGVGGGNSLGDEDPRMRSLPPPPNGAPSGSNNSREGGFNNSTGSGSEEAKVSYTSLGKSFLFS